MNQFQFKKSRILRSELNFTGSKKQDRKNFTGDAAVSCVMRIPKEPEVGKNVLFDASFSAGGPDEPISMEVLTRSVFKIEELDNPSSLREDAKGQCRDVALGKLYEKVRKLYKLHTGYALSIPEDGGEDE